MSNNKKIPAFLSKLNKSTEKMGGVSNAATFPEFFFDSGNCIINKIISDKYDGGYAQGRLALIAGPSNSGKSFLIGNAIKQALNSGYGVLVIDSENALDDVYLTKIGANIDSPLYDYKGLNTIEEAQTILSEFFKFYKEENEKIPFLIAIDSLKMLRTKQREERENKGEVYHDMGNEIKQLGSLQEYIMHNIKELPIGCVITHQPYANQDPIGKLREPYVITDKLRFPHSQILAVTNTLLKDKATKKFEGINLTVFGQKTRFAKPFQKCLIEVPYESGIDWYSGVLEAAESVGVVSKNGAWYTYKENKFQKNGFDEYKEDIFNDLKKQEGSSIQYELLDEDSKGK